MVAEEFSTGRSSRHAGFPPPDPLRNREFPTATHPSEKPLFAVRICVKRCFFKKSILEFRLSSSFAQSFPQPVENFLDGLFSTFSTIGLWKNQNEKGKPCRRVSLAVTAERSSRPFSGKKDLRMRNKTDTYEKIPRMTSASPRTCGKKRHRRAAAITVNRMVRTAGNVPDPLRR